MPASGDMRNSKRHAGRRGQAAIMNGIVFLHRSDVRDTRATCRPGPQSSGGTVILYFSLNQTVMSNTSNTSAKTPRPPMWPIRFSGSKTSKASAR